MADTLGTIGTVGGSALGGPIGGMVGGAVGSYLGSQLGGGSGKGPTTQGTSSSTYTPVLLNTQGGLFNTTFGPSGANIGYSPAMQDIQNRYLSQAGGITPLQQQYAQLGQGFLGQVGAFDPFAAAETQFNRLEAILNPAREQQRQAQESRLYAQGRLGSTGGGLEQQAFQTAIEQQRAQNLINALGQAQDIQGNLISRGTALSNMPIELQNQAIGNLLNIQGAGMQQLRGGAFGGGTTTGATSQYVQGPGLKQQIGEGLLQGGMGMFGQGLTGLFSGSPSSTGNVAPETNSSISSGTYFPGFGYTY